MEDENPVVKGLERRELAGITFIRNYLQLSFDDPRVTAYSWPRVNTQGKSFEFDTPGYRDALCEQIGKKVVSAKEIPEQDILIDFEDGSQISLPLRDEDRRSPDAVAIEYEKTRLWHVW